MRLRTVLILALLVLVGLFALLNWSAITAPTKLDFLIASIEAPLGLLLLFSIGILAVFFLLVLARSEIAMLMESRRLTKELENARRSAADSETSRVESMRGAVLNEIAEVNKKLDAMAAKSGSGSGLV